MRQLKTLHTIRKRNEISKNIVHIIGAMQYTLYSRFFLKKLYSLYLVTEIVLHSVSHWIESVRQNHRIHRKAGCDLLIRRIWVGWSKVTGVFPHQEVCICVKKGGFLREKVEKQREKTGHWEFLFVTQFMGNFSFWRVLKFVCFTLLLFCRSSLTVVVYRWRSLLPPRQGSPRVRVW
jgi:hypothetical protein